MSTLRYEQASAAALAAELRSGRQVVSLRPLGRARPGESSGLAVGASPNGAPGTGSGGPGSDADAGAPAGTPEPGADVGTQAQASELASLLGTGRLRSASVPASAVVAAAVGAALSGVRPVVELRTEAAERQGWTVEGVLAELAATARPGSASDVGSGTAAVTLRVVTGRGSTPAWAPAIAEGPWDAALATLLLFPGLKVAAPATAVDCYGLTRAALQDDGNVVVLEAAELSGSSDEVADDAAPAALGRATVARSGDQLTIVAARRMLPVALAAAGQLARRGIEADVIDPRSLAPFDDAAVASSLSRTARLLVVQDDPLAASWAAALVARLTSGHFGLFDAPPRLVGRPDASSQRGHDAAATAEGIAAAAIELATY